MDNFEISFSSKLFVWDGPNPWYFTRVPEKESGLIRIEFRHLHRGWGSLPVFVNLGEKRWKTSIFWEKAGTYMLPIKKEIRVGLDLKVDQKLNINLEFEKLI